MTEEQRKTAIIAGLEAAAANDPLAADALMLIRELEKMNATLREYYEAAEAWISIIPGGEPPRGYLRHDRLMKARDKLKG